MDLRPPAKIAMTDDWSCTSCVTLQILHMLGLKNPPLNVKDMDKQLGRKRNQPISMGSIVLELLRHRLTVTTVVDTDKIDKMLGPNGFKYARQVYKFLTPAAHEAWIKRGKAFEKAKQALPGKDKVINCPPSIDAVSRLMTQEECPLVIFPLDGSDETSTHLSVIYGITPDQKLKVYVPADSARETLWKLAPNRMQTLYAKGEGIIGIRHPS